MATQSLDTHNSPAPQRWRGVVRFFAWLTIFGAGTPLTVRLLESRHWIPSDGSGLTDSLSFELSFLMRTLTQALSTTLSGVQINATSLLFAPLVIATLSAFFSLGGSHWQRITLSLLGWLIAVFNLLALLILVWAFSWDENAAGVIDTGVYAALSASLMTVVVAFGFLFLALASAWRWPRLDGARARVVARWWVVIIACGGALLIGSYLMAWGHWRSANAPVSSDTVMPIALFATGPASDQSHATLLLCALPVAVALCAYLMLRAPRWGRAPLALLGLLAGGSNLIVGLVVVGAVFLRVNGASALDTGGAVGLGASVLIIVAAFGLLSTPYPARATPAGALTGVRQVSAPAGVVAVGNGERSQDAVAVS